VTDSLTATANLDSWILATAPDAVAYASSLLRNRAAGEDVVQECYCRLLQKRDSYDLLRDGRKLLFESITNACINRTTRARPIASLDTDGNEGGSLYGRLADPSARSAEQVVLHRELVQAVADALGRLPVLQRAALEMKSLGHSLEDIARALNTTASHAGVLVYRARQTLARQLAPYLEEKAG
jgi:RNA polymerase sigma-70 factor (ECF subfamily)